MKSNPFVSRLALMLCGSGLMLTAACVGPAAPDGPDGPDDEVEAVDAPAADTNQAPAEQAARRGMRGHKGGHMGLIQAALDLELSAEQRTAIEKLQADLKPSDDDRRTHEAFNKALAEQVKAGSINAAELNDEIAAIQSKMAAKKEAHAKALDTLHGILSAEQRAQLVDTLAQRQQRWAGKGRRGPEGGPDGERAPGPRGERAGKRGRRGMRGPGGEMGRDPMRGMLRGLDLTDEQRTKLDAARESMKSERPTPEAMKERFAAMKEKMEAFHTAFKSDSFDAKTSMPEPPMGDMMSRMFEHKVKALESIVPILTAEQRAELSERILRAPDMKRGGPHKRGGHMRGPRGAN